MIAAYHGAHDIVIGAREGNGLELHASSQSQVMLAFGDPSLIEETCSADLPALTSKTITGPNVLRDRIDDVRRKGCALAPEEILLEVNVITAPVFDHNNQLIGTVALAGSISQTPGTWHRAMMI
ncbi:IclR family transcriptional regulator domain-containing protein [Paracoccus alkanivorans]|uniref:IclR family transcriptional regulator domain-containing protein n=1 Tax=Paracoccus alkanivorans TaxID=2116655 RepID=UPI003C7E6D4E